MSLRPGWENLFATAGNVAAKYIPFTFSTTDVALAEVTATGVRIAVNDAIVTRPSVSTAITNGTFDSDVASWTDNDESGAVSAWLTGGYCELVGTLFNAAIRRQEVTVAGGDQSVEHGVTFVIERGPVTGAQIIHDAYGVPLLQDCSRFQAPQEGPSASAITLVASSPRLAKKLRQSSETEDGLALYRAYSSAR